MCYYVFFFFQAEDGIRDKLVTGVQTCALPIFRRHEGTVDVESQVGVGTIFRIRLPIAKCPMKAQPGSDFVSSKPAPSKSSRSEERRVGKECRSRWSPYH